jgi:tellurite resistance protein TerC
VTPDPWIWAVFVGLVTLVLALDLFVFHRHAHAPSMREAAIWSAVWVALALVFGGLVWVALGPAAASAYVTGYLIEKSLSVDNIFVFALLFSSFGVPVAYQHRVLFWGVIGAIALRAGFIAAGAALLESFHAVIYVFGALLVLTGLKMVLRHDDRAPSSGGLNFALGLIRRFVPVSSAYHGQRFLVRQGGRLVATPLLAVLLAIELTDVLFAVDSIPAIFAVTQELFLVLTASTFAILGLRALYFLLAGMLHRFVYLRFGLAVILVVVGSRMLLSDVTGDLPSWVSLVVISTVLSVSIVASLWASGRGQPPRRTVYNG